jgi:hypothetical protein
MTAGVKFVNEGGSLREVARFHGVTHKKLWKRVVGMVDNVNRDLLQFSKEEADRNAKYVIDMADMGFDVMTCDVCHSMQYIKMVLSPYNLELLPHYDVT